MNKRRSKSRFFFKKLIIKFLLLINLACAVALLLAYLSVWVSPAKVWPLAFFGLTYPYLLLANLLFILLWLLLRKWLFFLSLLAVLTGVRHFRNYFRIFPQKSEESGITVCSYNVKHFNENKVVEASRDAICKYLQSKDADIICLQEMPPISNFNPFLPDSAHKPAPCYSSVAVGTGGSKPAIYSRYKLVNIREISFTGSDNRIVYADTFIDGDTIRIFSCHLQSYHIDDNSLDDLSRENDRKKSVRKLRTIVSKLKQGYVHRTEHAERLAEEIRRSPYEVIVCGDFNDTPVSYTYRTIRRHLLDAFVESGSGTGNSYRGKLPSFRIDYIMHSGGFHSYNFKVDRVTLSDHFPVSCKLVK
ncbi:MAG: endonuclease/exonuclease/phosphatase family protein [Bacteroidales bacterium]|jgi:endonuclease/exonuclease/phosphatase family metal-dependent hydrolase|nr:endonuclease/exonuclease/phosphatase family protein [Bacteroidales bacterium]